MNPEALEAMNQIQANTRGEPYELIYIMIARPPGVFSPPSLPPGAPALFLWPLSLLPLRCSQLLPLSSSRHFMCFFSALERPRAHSAPRPLLAAPLRSLGPRRARQETLSDQVNLLARTKPGQIAVRRERAGSPGARFRPIKAGLH